MNLKLIKKGFTVVELVIVIAAVAVLAAVLIPTFSNLIYEVNYSADIQMVTSLNKYLALAEISDGKNETMYEALQDANDAGYDLTKLVFQTENDILWNQETDRFIAVNKKGKIFSQDETVKNTELKGIKDTDYKYWKIYNENNPIPNINKQTFSIYWTGENAPTSDTLNVSVGFDAGEFIGEDLIIIVYTSLSNIKVRLQRGHLAVTAPAASKVYCYGVIDTLYYSLNNNIEAGQGILILNNANVGYLNENSEGKLSLNNVKFHQDSIVGLKIIIVEKNNDEYGKHYPDEENCVFCNKTENPGHIHTIETTFENATCTEEGSISIKCTNCEYSLSKTIDAYDHDFAINEKRIEPTCEKAGQEEGKVCRRCGLKEGGNILPPLNHSFDNEHKCTICNQYESDIPNVGIRFENGKLIYNYSNMGEDFDKRTQSFIVKLESDLEFDCVELTNLFGVTELFTGFDNNSEVNVQYEFSQIFSVDIDLNGYTLTINGDNDPILIYGSLRIRNGKLNARNDCWGSAFCMQGDTAMVEFNNLTGEIYGPQIAYFCEYNKINIINTTLINKKDTSKEFAIINPVYEAFYGPMDEDDYEYLVSKVISIDENSKILIP